MALVIHTKPRSTTLALVQADDIKRSPGRPKVEKRAQPLPVHLAGSADEIISAAYDLIHIRPGMTANEIANQIKYTGLASYTAHNLIVKEVFNGANRHQYRFELVDRPGTSRHVAYTVKLFYPIGKRRGFYANGKLRSLEALRKALAKGANVPLEEVMTKKALHKNIMKYGSFDNFWQVYKSR